MGLYIPNAKIPVSCNKCYEIGLAHRLRDLGGHCPRMDLHYSPDEQDFKGDRRADCHLLDVPPHGRLIDADAFTKDECNSCDGACEALPCNCLNCEADCRCDFMKDIAYTPSIIPAEEGKE